MTAPDSAGSADRPRPSTNASSVTPPITAARSTLGEGRASTTKPTRATPATTADVRGPAPANLARPSTAPQMIATLVPDTASQAHIRRPPAGGVKHRPRA